MQPIVNTLGNRTSTVTGGDQEFYGGKPPFMAAVLPQSWWTQYGIKDSDIKGPGIPQPVLFSLRGLKKFLPPKSMLPQAWDTGPSPYGRTDTDIKGIGIPQPLMFNVAGMAISGKGMFHPAKSTLPAEAGTIYGITGTDVEQSVMAKPIVFVLNGLKGMSGGVFHPTLPNPPETPGPSLTIQGTTKDEKGNPAIGFTVYLFNVTSGTPVLVQTATSDGSGLYSFTVDSTQTYWVVDYSTGTPDKTGATLNTLTGGNIVDIYAIDPTATPDTTPIGSLLTNVSTGSQEILISAIMTVSV